MPFEYAHSARVRDPDDFYPGSFRTVPIGGGISIIMGKIKGGNDSMVAQTYRFATGSFTPEQARAWMDKHDKKFISFEPAVTGKTEESKTPEVTGGEDRTVTGEEFEQLEEATPNALPGKFVGEDGTAMIKIIAPGWGSSGYYSEAMLERDASKVYVPATHMHIDHPTPTQEKGLPERSLTTLAGVITGAGQYLKNGLQGPGVYAEAKIFSQYRNFLNEMAPYIGVSHRAIGKAVPGTAEGKSGKIIEALQKVMSVDFVTLPGAGGGLVQMYESYRDKGESTGGAPMNEHKNTKQKEESDMGDIKDMKIEILMESRPDLVAAMKESILTEIKSSEDTKGKEAEYGRLVKDNGEMKKEISWLQEAKAIQEAAAYAGKELAKTALPDVTKVRLAESLPKSITMKDGKLDEAAFAEAVKAAIKSESEYVAKVTEAGKVRGFGSGSGAKDTTLKETFKATYLAQGKSESEADKLAALAASGR